MITSNQIIGSERKHFTQVDSTNTEAKRLIDAGAVKEGLVITADYQTQGRGQYGRVWDSKLGQNMIMSIVIAPIFLKVKDQFSLNIIASLAVVELAKEYCKNAISVKWPNDVYVGSKKLSGILIQNFIQGDQINKSIMGIGINVNQQIWPDEVTRATSLSLEAKALLDRDKITNDFCIHLDKMYKKLQLFPEEMKKHYTSLLFRRGVLSAFEKADGVFVGEIQGIDEIGKLEIKVDGLVKSFTHGEISQIIS